MASTPIDKPGSLGIPAERQRRRALLVCRHMRPLKDFVEDLRQAHPNVQVPDFDPLDGGVDAQVLFLFQKPSKEAVAGNGSGFISRNNDDSTAKRTFSFMREAGIPRKLTITWNVVPWWDGCNDASASECRTGIIWVRRLLNLLPNLRAVVLVGTVAQGAWPDWLCPDLLVVRSYHPSPRGKTREQLRAIPQEWAKVWSVLDTSLKQS